MNEEQYLTVEQVARRLQVSKQAVYNWINEGRLSAVRAGRALRIAPSALLAFLQPVQPGEVSEEDDQE